MDNVALPGNTEQAELDQRIVIADDIVSAYNLGEGVTVASMDNWDVSDRDDLTKIIYVEYDTDGPEDDSHRISFHVRFSNGLTVEDAYGLEMEKGGEVGTRGDNCVAAG